MEQCGHVIKNPPLRRIMNHLKLAWVHDTYNHRTSYCHYLKKGISPLHLLASCHPSSCGMQAVFLGTTFGWRNSVFWGFPVHLFPHLDESHLLSDPVKTKDSERCRSLQDDCFLIFFTDIHIYVNTLHFMFKGYSDHFR